MPTTVLPANGSSAYNLSRSVRLRSSASAYLSKTFGSAGNRNKWTFSAWVKLGTLSTAGVDQAIFTAGYNTVPWFALQYQGGSSPGTFQIAFTAGSSGGSFTNAVYRDPSAWYHIVLAVDTTQATAANRVLFYVNGVSQSFGTTNYPAQNFNTQVNNSVLHTIGGYSGSYCDNYIAEVNFIDGQALTPTSFGAYNSTTGVWQPIKYTGTYGTNGFYLNFNNNASTTTLGYDTSGNGNNWTTNNISLTAGTTYDSMTDVPTLTSTTAANYCTLNPLDKYSSYTAQDGNLTLVGSANYAVIRSTFGVSSGKWYFEAVPVSGTTNCDIGIATALASLSGGAVGSDSYGWSYDNGGGKYHNGSSVFGSSYTTGDVIGVAFDMDNGYIWFAKNNTWQASGNPSTGANPAFTGITGTVFPALTANNNTLAINFGQRPFSYTPPTGFVALNTYNLPTPTIVQGNKYFDATTYTGTGASLNVTNGGSFKPDLVWVKDRSAANSNGLYDTIRGATYGIRTDSTVAETQFSASSVTAFLSNGFTVGSYSDTGASGHTYIGWQWNAGSGSSSSNTNGSITSTVSVNATAGFSIVTYTGNGTGGATVGHGLNAQPYFIIVKNRSSATDWPVFHFNMGVANPKDGSLFLDTTAAFTSDSTVWNGTFPGTSTFTVGTSSKTNTNGNNYVAYCWTQTNGFSKFGNYTGNGSTEGPFVYCGFRPRWLLLKNSSSVGGWVLLDSSRNTYNVVGNELYPNQSNAEGGGYTDSDFLSNGFKLRVASDPNANGTTYVYAAFAENPFKNSLAR